jgi:hypothetical protein
VTNIISIPFELVRSTVESSLESYKSKLSTLSEPKDRTLSFSIVFPRFASQTTRLVESFFKSNDPALILYDLVSADGGESLILAEKDDVGETIQWKTITGIKKLIK